MAKTSDLLSISLHCLWNHNPRGEKEQTAQHSADSCNGTHSWPTLWSAPQDPSAPCIISPSYGNWCWAPWLHTGHRRTMESPQVRWNSWQHCFFDQQSQTRKKAFHSLNNSVPSFHYEKTLNMPRNAFAHISCESLHLPKAGIIYLS